MHAARAQSVLLFGGGRSARVVRIARGGGRSFASCRIGALKNARSG